MKRGDRVQHRWAGWTGVYLGRDEVEGELARAVATTGLVEVKWDEEHSVGLDRVRPVNPNDLIEETR